MPLIILAVGILLLFFLIVRVKLNSFISLLIVAGVVGYAEGLPVTQIIPVIQKGSAERLAVSRSSSRSARYWVN